jgi:hypothetical protein
MNEERTGKCLRQVEHIRGHLWHRYSITVNLGHWRVSLVEQELLTLSELLSSPPGFSGVRVTRSLVLYVCFVDRCLSFCLLAIVLSVLRYTDSDYPFGIFKLYHFQVHWVAIISSHKARSLIGENDHWLVCIIEQVHFKKLAIPVCSFGHCVVCSSIYRFWLPLWYLQTLLFYDI